MAAGLRLAIHVLLWILLQVSSATFVGKRHISSYGVSTRDPSPLEGSLHLPIERSDTPRNVHSPIRLLHSSISRRNWMSDAAEGISEGAVDGGRLTGGEIFGIVIGSIIAAIIVFYLAACIVGAVQKSRKPSTTEKSTTPVHGVPEQCDVSQLHEDEEIEDKSKLATSLYRSTSADVSSLAGLLPKDNDGALDDNGVECQQEQEFRAENLKVPDLVYQTSSDDDSFTRSTPPDEYEHLYRSSAILASFNREDSHSREPSFDGSNAAPGLRVKRKAVPSGFTRYSAVPSA